MRGASSSETLFTVRLHIDLLRVAPMTCSS